MRRILCLTTALVMCICLFGCGSGDVESQPTDEIVVAIPNDGICEKALLTYDYGNKNMTKVKYNTESDVVLAVEKGKADYGILDEYAVNEFLSKDRSVEVSETLGYCLEYVAYFSMENQELCGEFAAALSKLKDNGELKKIKDASFEGISYETEYGEGDRGTLVMLCVPDFENRCYYNEDEALCGVDIDTARAVCAILGYELDYEVCDFDELFQRLEDGEGDFVMAEYKENRFDYYAHTDVYHTVNFQVISRES